MGAPPNQIGFCAIILMDSVPLIIGLYAIFVSGFSAICTSRHYYCIALIIPLMNIDMIITVCLSDILYKAVPQRLHVICRMNYSWNSKIHKLE